MRMYYVIICLFLTLFSYGQKKKEPFRVMFCNVENLFHPSDEKGKCDEEYTPSGSKHWTYSKYKKKISFLTKVIAILGEWEMPSLIGLAEIENQKVLKDIIFSKGMRGYSFIHRESPDIRGIDVALLYKRSEFKPLTRKFYTLDFPFNPRIKSRDIIYVKGLVRGIDTLHVFVNHWPSRRGGSRASEKKRFVAAKLLRTKVDSIYANNSRAKIFIMGDFNDEPVNKSMTMVLKAGKGIKSNTDLVNMASSFYKKSTGTYKFKNRWNILDQIIVSHSMLYSNKGLFCMPNAMKIFSPSFLLERDKTYLGYKPFRTYRGPIYHKGFSDHLPVYLDLYLK